MINLTPCQTSSILLLIIQMAANWTWRMLNASTFASMARIGHNMISNEVVRIFLLLHFNQLLSSFPIQHYVFNLWLIHAISLSHSFFYSFAFSIIICLCRVQSTLWEERCFASMITPFLTSLLASILSMAVLPLLLTLLLLTFTR